MNFDDAINAHVNWKMKLRSYIDGTSKDKLDPATVCKDNVCPLGQWIYADGAKFKAEPEYEPMRTSHASFHVCAADVIKKSDAGDKAGAGSMLDSGTPYAKASNDVVMHLRTIRKKVEGK